MSLKFKFLSEQLLLNQNIETASQLCFVYWTVKCCKQEISSHVLYKGSSLFVTYFFYFVFTKRARKGYRSSFALKNRLN